MKELKNTVEEALFEARPYVEYYDRLRELVLGLLNESGDAESLRKRLEDEIARADEPFKTDLKIFLQKLEAMRT
ncbi:hypothetical protein [Thermococcus gammatolerans]|uniref:Uncharacterized protein n=1 Tax=Thermococcus gammatolerans (strain DSM 15229 / JCM 11827 / EJ3) TaxID=593117 RepID=C5A1N0_THEGJ|nr:hypothetical protein [Thermococcus gammatolerans]ACS34299.1 Conserved hypothetical protein [Thermococcus gammatolerans EJ3]